MRPLALALVLCGLVIDGTAASDQTCKAKATRQTLSGEALLKFVKKCETEALLATVFVTHDDQTSNSTGQT
jgi:hypothetical protein